MQITVTIPDAQSEEADLLSLAIFPDMTIETLGSSIEAETRIPPSVQLLYYDGSLISDKTKTIEQLNIKDGEMLVLRQREGRPVGTGAGASSGAAPTTASHPQAAGSSFSAASVAAAASQGMRNVRRETEPDPEMIRLQILGDPGLRQEVIRQQPAIAEALNSPQQFAEFMRSSALRDQRERYSRQRQIAELNADIFDVDAQRRIEEIIRQERVMENLQSAMEHNPEVFGRVHMLYVDVEVNGHKVKALVDSGAQATIMSPSCAEECGIMRLVDRRFAGVARGVGTAQIIGRVHSAQIKIGNLFLPCSFTVMEGKQVELLLGLDMLKRYQAQIDLRSDSLIIQDERIPFLGEADIPKDPELPAEPMVPGPAGTAIGGQTGAVVGPASGIAPGSEAQQPPQQPPASAAAASAAAASARAAAAPNPPAPPRAAAAAAVPAFPDTVIEQLMALGFSREAAIQALQATDGNVELAASLLFQG